MTWFTPYSDRLRNRLRGLLPEKGRGCRMQEGRDLEDIASASALLQISEYHFFRLSYSQWYGDEINEERLEKVFIAYMFKDEVPHWVRHLTRRVLDDYEEGRIDQQFCSLTHPQVRPNDFYLGVAYSVLVAFLMFSYCVILKSIVPPW